VSEQPVTHQEPRQGGSYTRNADGSLTLVERTGEAPQRDKRETDITPAPVDPGATTLMAPVVELGGPGHQE
jgi:hypothetical protein